MYNKANAHCAQLNTFITALQLAKDMFYSIGSAVSVYDVPLIDESKKILFFVFNVLAG